MFMPVFYMVEAKRHLTSHDRAIFYSKVVTAAAESQRDDCCRDLLQLLDGVIRLRMDVKSQKVFLRQFSRPTKDPDRKRHLIKLSLCSILRRQ